MNLSEHFTLDEATFSSTAVRMGIINQPSAEQLHNMQLAAGQMESVRSLLGFPIHIDSWLRVEALNAAVGGVGHSAHVDGWAIDFICPQFGTPQQIAQAMANANIPADEIIYEGNWCHVSFDPRMRHKLLTAHFIAGQPTTYTDGVVA